MVIELAGRRIAIENKHSYPEDYCMDYLVPDNGPVDIKVLITESDIDYERTKSEQESINEGIHVSRFSNEYLETIAVYRRIAEKMPFYNTMLVHGSCIAVDGKAYLFTARSGTGKSTHTRLWRELLKEHAVMVNDDKPLIHVSDDGTTTAYGTPWDGKHRLSSNISVHLEAICILERAENNRIREISKQEALPMLYQQIYRPMDAEAMKKTIQLIDRLNVKFYRLGCNMDLSAAELSYNTMKE